MDKKEYLKKLDSLNLDKNRYCIISGGVMLLYGLKETTEIAVLDYEKSDVKFVDGYPVESLELQLKWMLDNNRPKDKEKIKIIKKYLKK